MIWDMEGDLVLPIRPRDGGVSAAEFLPDGRPVLIGTTAHTTMIVPVEPDHLIDLARSVQMPSVSEPHQAAHRARMGAR